MAKKATTKSDGAKGGSASRAVARQPASSGGKSQETMGESLIKLLQSPLVAELLAVAATAALASLAEHGFATGGGGGRGKRAGKAVKEAGKAAAAAIGRRIGNEFEEIRKSSKAKSGAGS